MAIPETSIVSLVAHT